MISNEGGMLLFALRRPCEATTAGIHCLLAQE
jgi:hypothetical protein